MAARGGVELVRVAAAVELVATRKGALFVFVFFTQFKTRDLKKKLVSKKKFQFPKKSKIQKFRKVQMPKKMSKFRKRT